MESRKLSEALLELGKIASFDRTRLSPSTIDCMLSHVRLLQRNGVPLTRQQLVGQTVKTINSLRDTHGKPLSTNYKRQVLMTIKRLFPHDGVNSKAFGSVRVKAASRLMSDEYMLTMKKIIERAALVIGRAYDEEEIENLGMYDACISVLITCSTSLRIHEIMGLKLRHMDEIRNNVPIAVKSKGQQNLRNVAPNNLLLSVFRAIEEQRPKVSRYLQQANNNRRSVRTEAARYEARYIVLSSKDFMRKKLRELAAALTIPRGTLGFNSFRSFVVSMLVDHGGYELAQSMNNHSSLNTTLDHYNVVTPRAAETTYERMGDLMRALTPGASDSRGRLVLDAKLPVQLEPIVEEEDDDDGDDERRPQLRSLPYETPAWQPGDVSSK